MGGNGDLSGYINKVSLSAWLGKGCQYQECLIKGVMFCGFTSKTLGNHGRKPENLLLPGHFVRSSNTLGNPAKIIQSSSAEEEKRRGGDSLRSTDLMDSFRTNEHFLDHCQFLSCIFVFSSVLFSAHPCFHLSHICTQVHSQGVRS